MMKAQEQGQGQVFFTKVGIPSIEVDPLPRTPKYLLLPLFLDLHYPFPALKRKSFSSLLKLS